MYKMGFLPLGGVEVKLTLLDPPQVTAGTSDEDACGEKPAARLGQT